MEDIKYMADDTLRKLSQAINDELVHRKMKQQKGLWENVKNAVFAYLDAGYDINFYADYAVDSDTIDMETPGMFSTLD